jgi:hypothetical protein
MTASEEGLIVRLAMRHSVSPDAVRTVLRALRTGGGMAQFSHPDFGGMSQWSTGMTMVGDMFNDDLKSKLNALCADLSAYLAATGTADKGSASEDSRVSYRSAVKRDDWLPAEFGTPSAVGSQNSLRYAVFPEKRRLVIDDGGRIDTYDTGNHKIYGIAQAQSTDQTLTFTSQDGLVRVADLAKV